MPSLKPRIREKSYHGKAQKSGGGALRRCDRSELRFRGRLSGTILFFFYLSIRTGQWMLIRGRGGYKCTMGLTHGTSRCWPSYGGREGRLCETRRRRSFWRENRGTEGRRDGFTINRCPRDSGRGADSEPWASEYVFPLLYKRYGVTFLRQDTKQAGGKAGREPSTSDGSWILDHGCPQLFLKPRMAEHRHNYVAEDRAAGIPWGSPLRYERRSACRGVA